ncbi:uncharacterized protein [Epargyreus clarus]|uniref:uncharacterized protein n=1 Tax=Epargyreus clarus TaxID=520877 RepID=UPI003C2C9092
MSRFKKQVPNSVQNESLHFQNIIKPLYIVMSLLGLFPYSVNFVKNKHGFDIIPRSIYANSLCGVTVCLLIFAFLALHIQEVLLSSESINLTEALMTQINYVLELLTLITFSVVAYVCAFLNRTKYVKMLNQITSSWYDLPANNNSANLLKNLRFQVNVVCMGSLLVIVILQVSVNYTRDNSFWKMILVTFTFNLPQMVQFVTLAFFYILVMMVVALMTNIRWHCQLLKNTNTLDGFIQVQNRPSLTLRQMELLYIKVFEIKTNINEAFQGPILITTLQCFHSMVSESHIIYHGLVVHKSITTHEIMNCSIWIMYQIWKIYCIAYSGHLLKLQALKLGQILHNIPTEKHDSRWLMEIQHFSTLMYYQDIELTVYDYFPLNATLIYNTMASATMYLIILVQFDMRD